ncbi:hypothetical protein lerEdw1_008010 [Lerista edwardsae]|nr:hypothetical protein lerEdw1_008010 [Lerista edwardsae]
MGKSEANQVLKIQKRANAFLEELKPGSVERECVEEVCDFEEASEIFGTVDATEWLISSFNLDFVSSQLSFWTKYVAIPYSNCSTDNGGCEHFCNEDKKTYHHRFCSCPPGYRLMENHTNCEPVVMFPCGRTVQRSQSDIPKVIGGKMGRKGDSPWQVMLSSEMGRFKCGAVLIHPSWVLTAAHCVVGHNRVRLKFGKYFRRQKEESEQIIIADKLFPHENYSATTSDNDIAMLHLTHPVIFNKYILPICLPTKNLAEQELMTEGTTTIVTGWGSQSEHNYSNYSSVLRYIEVPVAPRNDCINAMQNDVSDNMLCAGIKGDRRDSCEGDSGGPMVTQFKNTWFLVGLVSWGEGCGNPENFGIYIKQPIIFIFRKEEASQVLRISKRANKFLEEIYPGNLERECIEETCSFEEAKEIFKSQEKTLLFCALFSNVIFSLFIIILQMEFWFHYKDRFPCGLVKKSTRSSEGRSNNQTNAWNMTENAWNVTKMNQTEAQENLASWNQTLGQEGIEEEDLEQTMENVTEENLQDWLNTNYTDESDDLRIVGGSLCHPGD